MQSYIMTLLALILLSVKGDLPIVAENQYPPIGYVAKPGSDLCRCQGNGLGLNSCGDLCCPHSPYTSTDPNNRFYYQNGGARDVSNLCWEKDGPEYGDVISTQWCSEHKDRMNICDGDFDSCWKAGMDLCDSEGDSCFGVMINPGWMQAFKGVKTCLSNVMADKPDWLTRMKISSGNEGFTYSLVIRQTLPYLFSPNEHRLNADDPTNENYAILDELESFRYDDGKFYFRLTWPEDSITYEWSQTSNPLTEAIAGYEPISVPYSGKFWGGLEPGSTSRADDGLSLMDGSVNHVNWYYAVGAFTTWQNGIPSYAKSDSDAGYPQQSVELYVRGALIEKTMVAVELSSDALQVVTDIGEQAFNAKFKACPVVQYNRNGAVHSVYKRITPIPDNFNAYKIFTETWRDAPTNTMGTDFEIFSNVNDLLNDQNQWTYCNYNDPDVAYPRDCGRHGWVPNEWFSMPGDRFNARGITNGAGFTLFNECPIDFAFWEDCRWESNHDQTPNSANYMGWTCADNEILTGFGLSANQHDVTKVQCCKLGGHSSVKPNTCTYVDSNHERAKCGNGNDHMVFSGAYDKRAATVDAVTEILAGKCCEVECDSAWCAGKDWGVDKNNCQVISTSNTNAQDLVCPEGTLLTEVEDGLTGNAHGVQKVASVTCCALDLIAPPTKAPSAAPTTARPTSVPTGAPSTSMPTLAPTSTDDCLLGLRDPQLTDSEYLSGIDRCLPGCRSPSRASTALHRRALESRLLSENNRRQ